MTMVDTLYEKALHRQRTAARLNKVKKAAKVAACYFASFALPLSLSVVAAFIIPALFPAAAKDSFWGNYIYSFSKLFFVCTPVQVLFIIKHVL